MSEPKNQAEFGKRNGRESAADREATFEALQSGDYLKAAAEAAKSYKDALVFQAEEAAQDVASNLLHPIKKLEAPFVNGNSKGVKR